MVAAQDDAGYVLTFLIGGLSLSACRSSPQAFGQKTKFWLTPGCVEKYGSAPCLVFILLRWRLSLTAF